MFIKRINFIELNIIVRNKLISLFITSFKKSVLMSEELSKLFNATLRLAYLCHF
jgi:hypothetical protein